MKKLIKKCLLCAVTLLMCTAAFAQGSSNATISTNNNGKTVEISLQNDQLTALSIDGKQIPQSEWKNYSELVNTTLAKVKTDNENAKKDRERATQDRIRAARDRENAIADTKRAQADLVSASDDRKRASADHRRAAEDRERAKRDKDLAAADRAAAAKDRERATLDQQMIKSLTADLVADHIIKDAGSLRDLEITETGIIVNKIKQPDAVFKKYSSKYGSFAGRNFKYAFHQEIRN